MCGAVAAHPHHNPVYLIYAHCDPLKTAGCSPTLIRSFAHFLLQVTAATKKRQRQVVGLCPLALQVNEPRGHCHDGRSNVPPVDEELYRPREHVQEEALSRQESNTPPLGKVAPKGRSVLDDRARDGGARDGDGRVRSQECWLEAWSRT